MTGALILMIVSLVGISRLEVEDNMGKYFSPSHPVRTELERMEKTGLGVFAAELILSRKGSEGDQEREFQNPRAQQELAKLSGRLRSRPLVFGALSSGDFVEASVDSLVVEGEVDENTRWMALGFIQMVPDGRRLLYSLMTEDGKRARITLLLPMLSFNRAEPLFDEVKAEAQKSFPDADIWITGRYPLILKAQGKLLRGLVFSLSLTLLCVAATFFLLLRDIRLTLRALLPNLWPVVLVLGGMGWLKLQLDSVSIMSVSVILGLAVDDTLHSLAHFMQSAPQRGRKQAIVDTLGHTAPAQILTSAILAAGFFICSFSDLLPIARWGALSAVAVLVALAGDLLLIPALLSNPRTAKKGHN